MFSYFHIEDKIQLHSFLPAYGTQDRCKRIIFQQSLNTEKYISEGLKVIL